MDIRELLNKLLDELRGAWRFRWLGIGVAWVICLVGWLAVFSMPDVYEADARVYVDTRSILRPLLQGLAINPDMASGLDLVRQVLLSRPQVERVARETDLDLRAKTPEAKEQLIRDLQSRISIDAGDLRARTSQGEGLYIIRFQDTNRSKAVEVVQTMLKSFVENALGDKRTGQATAQRFLDDQIKDYEKRLSDAEDRLAKFKQQNVGLMPDNRGDYFARLQQASSELQDVRSKLAMAESRAAEIKRQLSGEEPYLFGFDAGAAAAAPDSAAAGDLTFRIQALQKQLDDLLLRYTDKHPEVIATRKTIAELKKRQQEELARVNAGKPATGSMASSLKTNPVYQNLEIELKQTQVQIAEMRQDVVQRQTDVAKLRHQVDTVPEVEAELARLNRDYGITKEKYQELVQRRETANLSEEADRTGTVKFEVIDPPASAPNPVAPDRPKLLIAVLLLGLAVGGGLCWLLNQLKPVFHSMRTLAEVTGLPVFAAVSRTWVERFRQQRKTELLKFSAATVLLFVTYGVVSLFQDAGARALHRLIG